MKFANLGVFALLTPLASALSLGSVSDSYVIGALLSVDVILGDTLPGNFAFTFNQNGSFLTLLSTIEVSKTGYVTLPLPDFIEPAPGFQIGCCPPDPSEYDNPYSLTNEFSCVL